MIRRLSLLPLVLAIGCATGGTLQSAHTLAPGKSQFGVETNIVGVAAKDLPAAYIPQVNLTFRYGMVERFELGGRLGLAGLELTGKYQLTPPGAPGITASIAPSVGGLVFGFFNIVNGQLPVVIGIPLGEGSVAETTHVLLVPKLQLTSTFGGIAGVAGGQATALSAGASVGISLKLGETARIIPEATFLYPFYGNASAWAPGGGTGTSGATNASGGVFAVGIAFLFGAS